MKRGIAIFLCAVMAFSTFTAVFSAEDEETVTVNKSVSDKASAELYHGNDLINHPNYEGDKMFDGDLSTFAYAKQSNRSGHLAVVDLGQAYDITQISIDFPQADAIQEAIDSLSTADNPFKATATDANMRSVVFLSNTKPTTSMIGSDNYTYTGEGKVICDGSGSIRYSKVFTDSEIEDGNDYRYIGIWTPYSYGVAISELKVWADVLVSASEPIEMHFSSTEALLDEAVEEFGSGELYFNGRFVNDGLTDKEYKLIIASYKDSVLKKTELETVTVKAGESKDVSLQVWNKIGMDTIKGFVWENDNTPIKKAEAIGRVNVSYDPLFDGSILNITPKTYDALDVIEEHNKTAQTPLPTTGISELDNVKTIFYDGINYMGKPTKAFAYVGIPEGASAENPVPGIVLVHGGGGSAHDKWVKAWVDQGYAAIAMDTEGRIKTAANNYMGVGNRVASTFGHQNNLSYDNFIAEDDKHSDMWFYQATADAVLAGNVLRSMPEVDSSRIGITGISYGSLITLHTIGVDNRFTFAMPVYGCGYLWEGQTYFANRMTVARKSWDPSRFYMQSGDVPVMWFVTNRDQNFSLDTISKSYLDIFDKANMCIIDNFAHTEQDGTIIDPRTSSNGTNAAIREKMKNTMLNYVWNAFGDNNAKPLSKLSKLENNNGTLKTTVTLPEGVSADGGKAKLKYLTVENYSDCYYQYSDKQTYWVMGAPDNQTNSYHYPWPTVDATVDDTTITVEIPSDATYGYIEYTDSRNMFTTTEMIKFK